MPGDDRPGLATALCRGLIDRCPRCGQGRLFAGYIRQVDQCDVCGEAWGHVRADDAPPWLTILLVGHIVLPLALWVEGQVSWPEWVGMVLWPTLALALAALILPRAKAVMLTLIWFTRAPGSEPA
jgi:Uncharacterized protein conserved in bacteria